MKYFFYTIIFGGLAIVLGFGITYGSGMAWRYAAPRLADIELPSVKIPSISINWKGLIAAASRSSSGLPGDGTTITGISRVITFTADEEEDLINAAAGALPKNDKSITAGAYIVKDLFSGTVVTERNSDKVMPIASLTKLVTAVVARRLMDPDQKITIDRAIMATYGNTAGFRVGETFHAADLLYPLLMVSSNDTAEAYAFAYGRTKFIAAMNDFTQSIGAYRTHFSDPSGLSPDNISTANDLAIILAWIKANDPNILAITELKSKTNRTHTWVNPTHFLSWSNYVGGKNGYTPEANRTAASLFVVGPAKKVYSVVVLGSAERDNDEIKLLAKIK